MKRVLLLLFTCIICCSNSSKDIDVFFAKFENAIKESNVKDLVNLFSTNCTVYGKCQQKINNNDILRQITIQTGCIYYLMYSTEKVKKYCDNTNALCIKELFKGDYAKDIVIETGIVIFVLQNHKRNIIYELKISEENNHEYRINGIGVKNISEIKKCIEKFLYNIEKKNINEIIKVLYDGGISWDLEGDLHTQKSELIKELYEKRGIFYYALFDTNKLQKYYKNVHRISIYDALKVNKLSFDVRPIEIDYEVVFYLQDSNQGIMKIYFWKDKIWEDNNFKIHQIALE